MMERLKIRIQALLAKTVANGCTEAEALAAAAKVAELLDRAQLTLSDVEVAASPCRRMEFRPARKLRAAMDACVGAIAAYCDCTVWREKATDGQVVHVFFGLEADLDLAGGIAPMVEAALRNGAQAYKRSRKVVSYRQDEGGSFVVGMAVSIADRLIELKRQRTTHVGGGRDLVPVKRGVVEAEFAKLDLALKPTGPSGRRLLAGAFDAGLEAGGGFSLTARSEHSRPI